MKFFIGLIVGIASILGGYVLASGQLLAIWQPFEIMIIIGGALGGFIIANPVSVMKHTMSSLMDIIKNSTYTKQDYLELFELLYAIGSKIRKNGLMSIEEDVDNPANSELFKNYPKVLNNADIITFITDNLRTIATTTMPPHELEDLIDNELHAFEEQFEEPVHAVSSVADALPGFGIVAAVLGIVITMQFLGGDNDILGKKIAAALVGTFMGVAFAYAIFAPISSSLNFIVRSKMSYMTCIKVFIVSLSSGAVPQLSIEYARRSIAQDVRPSFFELESFIKSTTDKDSNEGG